MKNAWRTLRSLAADLPDHRFAIVAIIYAALVWWAVSGAGANLPGVNEFLRARSPEREMLHLKSQQTSGPHTQHP